MTNKVVITVVVLCMALMIRHLWSRGKPTIDDIIGDVGAPEQLTARMSEFSHPEVIKVADGVYVAVNYALANSILLEGVDGKVIVDTTESLLAATEIAKEFNKITDKETKALIYTHHHSDHTMGGRAFVDDTQTDVQIWAHRLFEKEVARIVLKGSAHFTRAMYQFGVFIQGAKISAGIGGRLRYNISGSQTIPPTHIMDDDDLDISIAGLNLRLIHIPGESSDQIGVWMPDKRILLCADDIYKAFPNLYAIRGVTPRDVMDWAESLDKMRQLRPECIVASHGMPVCGEQKIYDLLSDYMYGIQYVHDQTVRYINKGMHPDEIAKTVKLPEELVSHPYLIEYYGTVHWSAKAVYIMYMGWFSGEAVDLDTLAPTERAERMLKLVGKSGLLRAAAAALSDDDLQWALELATHVHRLDSDNTWAKKIRRDSMAKLAAKQMSAPGRNFYLTEMVKDEGLLPIFDAKKGVMTQPNKAIFQALRTRLKAEDLPVGEKLTGCFQFTDTGLHVSAAIIKGILEVKYDQPEAADCAFTIITTEPTWKELITQARSAIGGYLSGAVKIEGSLLKVRRFLNYFEKDS